MEDNYTNDKLNRQQLDDPYALIEPPRRAYVITAKKYGKYRDANWME